MIAGGPPGSKTQSAACASPFADERVIRRKNALPPSKSIGPRTIPRNISRAALVVARQHQTLGVEQLRDPRVKSACWVKGSPRCAGLSIDAKWSGRWMFAHRFSICCASICTFSVRKRGVTRARAGPALFSSTASASIPAWLSLCSTKAARSPRSKASALPARPSSATGVRGT
jgi:hypothetical protein